MADSCNNTDLIKTNVSKIIRIRETCYSANCSIYTEKEVQIPTFLVLHALSNPIITTDKIRKIVENKINNFLN